MERPRGIIAHRQAKMRPVAYLLFENVAGDIAFAQPLRHDNAAALAGARVVQAVVPSAIPPIDCRLNNGLRVRLSRVIQVVTDQVRAAKAGCGAAHRRCVAYSVLIVLKPRFGVLVRYQLVPFAPARLIPIALNERATLDAILERQPHSVGGVQELRPRPGQRRSIALRPNPRGEHDAAERGL